MDRPATRIYCGVAAFEREHALGREKRKSPGVPVTGTDSDGISYTFSARASPQDSDVRHSICFAIDRWIRSLRLCVPSCPRVPVHTNVLSHSSTVQGRDTIPG
ncbi:hypothetical protein X777_04775 [Ooceraea biroi]|uniref:Uncharacterized protein n=1 Tax=Ooceraea biroi TaxID=2015173 RepID=A0A026WGY1_OOCBI|nr:hypothetical protein X777_04775 [Ooceraea biroi]